MPTKLKNIVKNHYYCNYFKIQNDNIPSIPQKPGHRHFACFDDDTYGLCQ